MAESKRSVCEAIQMLLEGGVPNDEPKFPLRQILYHVNDAIAFLARKNAFENSRVEGVVYASDSFITTYRGLQVQTDSINGQLFIDLPSLPIGLPNNRGLVKVSPSKSYKNTVLKPISRREAARFYDLPAIPGKSFYYVESGELRFVGCNLLQLGSVDVSMITPGANDLDSDLNMPPDVAMELKDMVYRQLAGEMATDIIDDGQPLDSNTIN